MNVYPHHPLPAETKHSSWVLGIGGALGLFVMGWYFQDIGRAFPFVARIFDTGALPDVPFKQALSVWGGFASMLGTVLLVVLVTLYWGNKVRGWLGLSLEDGWVRLAFDFGLGILFLDSLWLGTGLVRLWFYPIWQGLGILLIIPVLWDGAVWLMHRPKFSMTSFLPGDLAYLFLLIIGALFWLFSVAQGLSPETFYDSMVYHLAVPQYWLLEHGLRDFPTNFFSNYPYNGELYFLNGFVLQGTESAKILHTVCFGVCALLAGGWARETAGEKAGWLAMGLTLTLPLFAVNTWATQVEGIMALAMVLFVYALFHASRSGQIAWLFKAGLFAGLSLSIKYTAGIGILCALLLVALQKPSLLGRSHWKAWAAFTLALCFLLGPWLLKTLSYTGNPIFPYAMSIFPGRHLTDASYQRLLTEQHAWAAQDLWSWLKLPWTLTMAHPDSYNFCGPVALALVPLLLLFRPKHPALRFLAWLVPLLFLAGLSVTHILKFMVPGFVFLFILAGAFLSGTDRPWWGRGTALAAGLAAALCFCNLAAISHYYYDCAGLWAGKQTKEAYLTGEGKITPYYPMAKWIMVHVPKLSRLLIVGDARGLYYGNPFLTNSVFDEQVLAKFAREEKDGAGIHRRVRQLGVDEIAVNGLEGIRVSSDYGHYDLTAEQWKILDDFFQDWTTLIYSQNLQAVYQVRDTEKTQPEILDLPLLFSRPASSFILDMQKRRWKEAGDAMDQVLALYPFSSFWKKQGAEYKKAAKEVLND